MNFLVYSNLWISLSACLLTYFYLTLANYPVKPFILIFVFSATLFVYTFQRIQKLKTAHAFSGNRQAWMEQHTNLCLALAILSFAAAITSLLFLDIKTLYVLFPVGIISACYVGGFFLKKQTGLRDLPFAKAYLVSGSWAAVTATLPLLDSGETSLATHAIAFLSALIFTFSLAIIFDLRDLNLDEPSKRTVPQLIGTARTTALAILCLSISMLIPIMLDQSVWPICLIVSAAGIYLISRAKKNQPDLFYSFWLDGFIGLPGLIMLVKTYF